VEGVERGRPARAIEGQAVQQNERCATVIDAGNEVPGQFAEAALDGNGAGHDASGFRFIVTLRCNVTMLRYPVKPMGRPREHDDDTREALIGAAEGLLERGGTAALSVRAVADEVGTTTRAVYSVFGSKEGLLAALVQRSFELLRDDIERLPTTDDPAADLVEAAVRVFRPMAIEHPSLFAMAFLRAAPDLKAGTSARNAARVGLSLLRERVQRLANSDLLGGREVMTAVTAFNALCQGMAITELRNPEMMTPDAEYAWRDAFASLLNGFRVPPSAPATKKRRARR
jgi:AcrR family transcriptional regulator